MELLSKKVLFNKEKIELRSAIEKTIHSLPYAFMDKKNELLLPSSIAGN